MTSLKITIVPCHMHYHSAQLSFYFAGEFGSERLVQKVVDTILRNTASKDGGESSKGAEGSTKAEWKDNTASKIILTGFKVCKYVSFDHSQVAWPNHFSLNHCN